MAVVLLLGVRMAPWLALAALVAEILVRGVPAPWPVLVLGCAWLAGGYAGAAVLLERRLRFDAALATLRDATTFVVTSVAATLLVGAGYIGLFVMAGVVPAGAFVRTVAQFWIGDLIGIVVTVPLLLVLARPRSPGLAIRGVEAVLQLASIALALFVVFGLGIGPELQLFYVLFLPLVWIAMRRGMMGTVVATVLVQVGLIATLTFGGRQPDEVIQFQLVMLALALTGLFVGVTVEERRAAERRLRDKQFELDRTLRAAAASELASTLAHELNQPLSAMASYARACQLLLERGDPARELHVVLQKVAFEANRAGTVVHRLREFVRSGSLRVERLGVAALLGTVTAAARPRGERHGVTIDAEAPPGLPDVLADRVQVETVLHNLIGNAIDALKAATGPRRVVLAVAMQEAGLICITVADTGPGVAPAVRETLFQPFASQKAEGLGLGLAISRTIVEAHGGRLWLEGNAAGATFCMTLPVAGYPS